MNKLKLVKAKYHEFYIINDNLDDITDSDDSEEENYYEDYDHESNNEID